MVADKKNIINDNIYKENSEYLLNLVDEPIHKEQISYYMGLINDIYQENSLDIHLLNKYINNIIDIIINNNTELDIFLSDKVGSLFLINENYKITLENLHHKLLSCGYDL